ncbi:MAG: site-2 protease family protein [Nitrospiria bacterium]
MDKHGDKPIQSPPGFRKGEGTALKDPSTNGHPYPYRNDTLLEAEKRPSRKKPKSRLLVPLVLFILTTITTLLAGAYQMGGDPWRNPGDLSMGIPFAFTLLSIFFVHEMGHYLTSKRYGVNTSLPYFIPGPWFPFGIGTFGAVIRIKSPIFRKYALLDIGAAGPIAGFVVSVVAVIIGLESSQIVKVTDFNALYRLGDPLMFTFIEVLLGKVPPAGHDIALNSIAFAGWIGFFITAMNLLPVGQLDGGHIIYALFGKKARFVSVGTILTLLYLGTVGWKGWFVWALMCALMGVKHPPVQDEAMPLDFKHRLISAVSVVIFVLTFMPNPFMIGS